MLAIILCPPPAAMASDLPVAVTASVPVPARIWAMPVGVVVNGRSLGDTGLVVLSQGQLFVRRDMPGQWGLRLPEGLARIRVEGADYASLEGVPGLSARLDGSGSTLLIDAEPSLFSATHFGPARQAPPVMEAVSAQYLGYDLILSRWSGKWAGSTLLDAGASGEWGVVGTTALLQQGLGGPGAVRLDSNYIRDFPDRRLRLTLGDTVTRGGEWNRPIRFAGIRLGTDFALTPSDITYPLPRLSGSSTLPSVVELAAVSSRQSMAVQPGDFAIDYQPVFTGAGEVTMTVRDMNGTARTVTQSFYTSPRLLREGLDDFSLEAGVARRDFGGSSFAYGEPFAAGFWRHGLGGGLTLGGRAEASGDVRMAGLGLGAILSSWGEVALSAAAAQSHWGTGLLWRAQAQRITARYSVTASYTREDADFVQVGADGPPPGKRRELIVAGSLTLGRRGSINADYLENDADGGYRFATSSLSYAASLGPAWITLGARRTRFSDSRNDSLFGSFTLPLGSRSNAGLFVQGSRAAASFSQTPPPDSGWGYRLLAARQRNDLSQWEAGATWRTGAGDIDLSMARMAGAGGVRLQAHGALLRAGGKIVAAPQLDYAFAVVDVGADQDVTVLFENRPVARKAGQGRRAVVTGLQPYAANRIAVDLDDLPIDTAVTSAEQVAVPGYRKAVAIRFARTSARPVTLRLVDGDGAPVEQGLTVIVEGSEPGISGHDGEIFLADAREGQGIVLTGPGMTCRAVVPALPDRPGTGRIAPVRCAPDGEGGR
ncbi:fimbria/pilus outer membrane usher protein [Sphingobium chlorophenolicum]|nr:fimbria/pilus outer membrane usher protein [Sphingobium chlorophenolicum]